ncbi:helix-turn-helix domain-containing protein [Shimazuella kribbensis]|uniref:helix-turn-helix domain-containing protein n=1 Tax=Shimazuella kribbensis TaxID=139808 RepID=UPI00040BE880|nr:helix-turn-helix transcriptional regulator [Shimazuella kribbensis]
MSVEIGNFLRQARESVGLSLDEVQEKTRIQKSFLEAIEKGDFDKLPSPFYVRTYLRSYANCVKVEPHYILREYRKKEQAERYQTGQFDASQLTEQLNKLGQTGMHKFGLTGAIPKVSPNTKPSTAVNRTSAKTALTIAKPVSNTGKLPMMQRREEIEKTLKPQVLSSNKTKKEQKFPSLLPSQALTTRGGNPTVKESRFSTDENSTVQSSNKDGSTSTEQNTSPQQKQTSRLQKQVTSPQSTLSNSAQFVPSRLSKNPESSTLSRTQAQKRPTQPEQVVSQYTKLPVEEQKTNQVQENNPLSRSSRFRNSTTLPTITDKFAKLKTGSDEKVSVENEETGDLNNNFGSRESRVASRTTGVFKESVSQEATEVPTLRRSSIRSRPTPKVNEFFSSRVIIASIVAVLLLGGIGWYLLSDSEEGTPTVQNKNNITSETKSEQKQQPAGPSSKTSETTSQGSLDKQSPGLYHLTGTNKAKVVLDPSGTSWVQIKTGRAYTADPTKYIKDVTLTSKDASLEYDHTFKDVPDLYIVLGSPDNVKVTVNGIPVASTKVIHIVKK